MTSITDKIADKVTEAVTSKAVYPQYPQDPKYQRWYELLYCFDVSNNLWLRITLPIALDFEISRNNLASTNTCRFTLYNLSKNTRDLMFRDVLDIGKPYNPKETGFIEVGKAEETIKEKVGESKLRNYVQLFAGYKSSKTMYLVFSGCVLSAYSYKQGVDYVTEINGYSVNLKDPLTYISYIAKAGSTYESVIRNIATQLIGLEEVKIDETLGRKLFEKDTVIMGTAEDILINQFGFKPYVDNNCLNVFSDSTIIKNEGDKVITLTADKGLLESPRRTQNGVKINMLFEPSLRVGQIVSLNYGMEQTYNETQFVVSGFRHSGSISTVRDSQTVSEVELIRGRAGYFRTPKNIVVSSPNKKRITKQEPAIEQSVINSGMQIGQVLKGL